MIFDLSEKIELVVGDLITMFNTNYGAIKYFKNGDIKELHTGGWSDNEYIIYKLMDTDWWKMNIKKVERGGHYYFMRLKNKAFHIHKDSQEEVCEGVEK